MFTNGFQSTWYDNSVTAPAARQRCLIDRADTFSFGARVKQQDDKSSWSSAITWITSCSEGATVFANVAVHLCSARRVVRNLKATVLFQNRQTEIIVFANGPAFNVVGRNKECIGFTTTSLLDPEWGQDILWFYNEFYLIFFLFLRHFLFDFDFLRKFHPASL